MIYIEYQIVPKTYLPSDSSDSSDIRNINDSSDWSYSSDSNDSSDSSANFFSLVSKTQIVTKQSQPTLVPQANVDEWTVFLSNYAVSNG